MIFGVNFQAVYGNLSFEVPGTLPMVMPAVGIGIHVSIDGACRPDHLRQRTGK
jgi:hypothetical protein